MKDFEIIVFRGTSLETKWCVEFDLLRTTFRDGYETTFSVAGNKITKTVAEQIVYAYLAGHSDGANKAVYTFQQSLKQLIDGGRNEQIFDTCKCP